MDKISIRGLLASSLYNYLLEVFGKICSRDLCTSSPRGITIVSSRQFRETFDPSKRRPSSPNTAPALSAFEQCACAENATPATVSECPAPVTQSDILELKMSWNCRAAKLDIAQKTAQWVKLDLRKRGPKGYRFMRDEWTGGLSPYSYHKTPNVATLFVEQMVWFSRFSIEIPSIDQPAYDYQKYTTKIRETAIIFSPISFWCFSILLFYRQYKSLLNPVDFIGVINPHLSQSLDTNLRWGDKLTSILGGIPQSLQRWSNDDWILETQSFQICGVYFMTHMVIWSWPIIP